MVFGNGVKSIQAAAYNGARTVCKSASAKDLQELSPSRKTIQSQLAKPWLQHY